jgi:membrane protease YdiL (CAAX protease family)
MHRSQAGYFTATRHPWPCLLFLLPLLAAYEGGVLWLGGTHPEALRNGADTWLHWGLEAFGLSQLYWAPCLTALVFLGWSWRRRRDRPDDLVELLIGMGLESMIFAGGLLALSRSVGPLLDRLGVALDLAPATDQALTNVITFVGAGIYEEVLFRLVLFGGLFALGRRLDVPFLLAFPIAALTAAVLFAAAHHAGPYGEGFDGYVFFFRTLAGLYFTLLFQLRGFGIAVGAHACYDVLVGVVLPNS